MEYGNDGGSGIPFCQLVYWYEADWSFPFVISFFCRHINMEYAWIMVLDSRLTSSFIVSMYSRLWSPFLASLWGK